MPKHDETGGPSRFRVATMETRMGPRLFVWDNDGNSHGMLNWARAFEKKFLGAGNFDTPRL